MKRLGAYKKKATIALVRRTVAMLRFFGASAGLPTNSELYLVMLLPTEGIGAVGTSIQLRDLSFLRLCHLRWDVRIHKSLLRERQPLALGLGLLCWGV
jgi:hypothetical protein